MQLKGYTLVYRHSALVKEYHCVHQAVKINNSRVVKEIKQRTVFIFIKVIILAKTVDL